MIIELQDGSRIDTYEHSMRRLFHYIPSITVEHQREAVDGRRGLVVTDSSFTERMITVEFIYESYDIEDFYLLRDELNAIFARDDWFYIIFKNEPYKKYKVRMNGSINLPPNMFMEQFQVEFLCDDIYALSIYPTSKFKKEWDIDMFAWNNSITWDEEPQYNFNTNHFQVYNLGTTDVDPRQDYLKITLEGMFTSQVVIINNTTGETYTCNTSLSSGDKLVLDGIKSTKNGQSVFRHTNKRLLKLRRGINDFTISGGVVTNISFDFNFLYL